MIKEIKFTKGNWEEDFMYAYSERFPFAPKFIQEEDCIVNGRNPGMKDGFDYTTIMTKEMYGKGTKLWVTTSFENYGAPLITITDTLRTDEEGNLKYGNYQEVVLWENGLNVWNLYMEDGTVKWYKLAAIDFSVETNTKQELYVEFMDKYVKIGAKGHSATVRIENMPEKFYIGITGCEDINRFYDLKNETE